MRENPFRNSSLARATEKINRHISANQITTTPSVCQMVYGGRVAPNIFLIKSCRGENVIQHSNAVCLPQLQKLQVYLAKI